MLTKIVSIDRVGKFAKLRAAADVVWKKYTLVLGANGNGKTTLCAILRSLKTGRPEWILGRKTLEATAAPAVHIRLDDTTSAIFDGGVWTSTCQHIEIFDQLYISKNVHSDSVETEHRRNLYRVIVGERGVRLAEEEATLVKRLRDNTAEQNAILSKLGPYIPRGCSREEFLGLPNDPNIQTRINDQQRVVDTIAEAASVRSAATFHRYSLALPPTDNLNRVLSMSLEGLSAEADGIVRTHFSNHSWGSQGVVWVEEGLKHTKNTCALCGQDVTGVSLLAAYRSIFTDVYHNHVADLARTTQRMAEAFAGQADQLRGTGEFNTARAKFWSRFIDVQEFDVAIDAAAIAAAREYSAALAAVLDEKRRSPLERISLSAAYGEAEARYLHFVEAIRAANERIDDLNSRAAAAQRAAALGNMERATNELNLMKATVPRHTGEIAKLCDDLQACIREKQNLETQKKSVRDKLDEYSRMVINPYEQKINDYLDTFNAGFSLVETRHSYVGGVATSSYDIKIGKGRTALGTGGTSPDQSSFQNTLSAGDKSTLALAFFLANLKSNDLLSEKIVVFDDPFSSQDSFRRLQTAFEILDIGTRCAQTVVLSHDAHFLREVWSRVAAADRVSLLLETAEGKSQFYRVDLDDACQSRIAKERADLVAFLRNGKGQPIDVVKKMRTVLETFMRFVFPMHFGEVDNLGEIVRKIKESGDDHPATNYFVRLDRINSYSSPYHHGTRSSEPNIREPDAQELRGFVRIALKIINASQA